MDALRRDDTIPTHGQGSKKIAQLAKENVKNIQQRGFASSHPPNY